MARNRLQTPQTPQTPETPQTPRTLPDCGLWALLERDCGRSCADCGLGALARQILFSSGPKLPFTRLKPLKPLNPLKPLDKLPMVLPYFWILDASDAPKPRTC